MPVLSRLSNVPQIPTVFPLEIGKRQNGTLKIPQIPLVFPKSNMEQSIAKVNKISSNAFNQKQNELPQIEPESKNKNISTVTQQNIAQIPRYFGKTRLNQQTPNSGFYAMNLVRKTVGLLDSKLREANLPNTSFLDPVKFPILSQLETNETNCADL